MSPKIDTADDYLGERHVYQAHRAGLPNLRMYVQELWRRRQFIAELSSTNRRSAHFDTVFGQVWLVLNPLLLAFVYFLLVEIIGGGTSSADFFAHLLAGLFVYYFISNSIAAGAKSVVGGGRLILNTAFPRALLPLESTLTAFMRFLPTTTVLAVTIIITGVPITWSMLWGVPIIAMIAIFAFGAAMIFATLQVYFRDTSSFLPYFLRIWLYLSPVLWYDDQVSDQMRPLLSLNPLFPLLGQWSRVMTEGLSPEPLMLVLGLGWALAVFVLGAVVFVSREREFAVRL